ncbi:hypothetical protein EYF80_021447 [Liparis tanakae]|uniref:Uncharacterized protein n=1 Tax=Liparis tanakae TaxID=230148 RepID=A0A4Z2HQZ6_9TELE|nr:hypothetical protein EYF80_021447 [Liparis tanakae]
MADLLPILTPGSQEDPRGTAPDEVVQRFIWGFPGLSTETSGHAENGSHEPDGLTMRRRLGSLYLMWMVEPSGRTSITGYSLSYFCRPQRTTDVLLEPS